MWFRIAWCAACVLLTALPDVRGQWHFNLTRENYGEIVDWCQTHESIDVRDYFVDILAETGNLTLAAHTVVDHASHCLRQCG